MYQGVCAAFVIIIITGSPKDIVLAFGTSVSSIMCVYSTLPLSALHGGTPPSQFVKIPDQPIDFFVKKSEKKKNLKVLHALTRKGCKSFRLTVPQDAKNRGIVSLLLLVRYKWPFVIILDFFFHLK